jgi:hypothetical protein
MKSAPVLVKLPSRNDEPIAPVTIFDAEGRVLRVVPAAVFHRRGRPRVPSGTNGAANPVERPPADWRPRNEYAQTPPRPTSW